MSLYQYGGFSKISQNFPKSLITESSIEFHGCKVAIVSVLCEVVGHYLIPVNSVAAEQSISQQTEYTMVNTAMNCLMIIPHCCCM
jgi:hypothetical protein